MAGNKRRNPKTPSPKKRASKRARATRATAATPDIHLPGGALQTSFRVEATPIAAASTSHLSAPRAPRVTFNPVVTTGSGNTTQLRPADPDDPFVGSGNSGPLFSSDNQDIPSHLHASAEEEDFNFNVSPSSSDNGDTGAQNAPQAAPSVPVQRQSEIQAMQPAPVGSGKGSRAADVHAFYEVEGDKKKCKFCLAFDQNAHTHTVRGYSDSTGTGTLRKHLFTIHIQEWIDECKRLRIKITSKDALQAIKDHQGIQVEAESQTQQRPMFTQENFVMALTEFIVASDQPISLTDSPQFRNLLLLLKEDLQEKDIPHRTTMTKHIRELKKKHLDSLSANMLNNSMGKISFTMDIWTDFNLKPYMAVTAHWLERPSERQQQKIGLRVDLIGFIHIPGSHTGDCLAEVFLFILDRLKLAKKIGWITMDNASNNDTFISALQRTLASRENSEIHFSGSKQRIRCFPHIVNLACKAMLQNTCGLNIDELDEDIEEQSEDPVKKIRGIIQHIRASSSRRNEFSSILQDLNQSSYQLIRDVDTRWSSTFLMIERALLLRNAINKYLDENYSNPLQAADWDKLSTIKEILELPHAYQQLLSAEKTPTLCEALPAFQGLVAKLKKYQREHDLDVYEMVQAGIQKLEEYQQETDTAPAYTLSIILNPRRKLQWFRRRGSNYAENARTTLLEALEDYCINSDQREPLPQQTTSWSESHQRALDLLELEEEQQVNFDMQDVTAEVDRYLAVPTKEIKNSIAYWLENQHQFPTLFKLAMDILPIQASSVPCERVFSSSKETITARRNSLGSDLMEALQLLKFATKQGRGMSFTEGLDREAELEELVKREEGEPFEDLRSFLRSLQD